MKKLILGLIFVLFILAIVSSAYAKPEQLIIKNIDAKVGGRTSKNLDNKQTISREAKPLDNVEIIVEVVSNYTTSDNIDIEGVTVQATVESIDDGDDIDIESADFTLRPGRDKKSTLKFQVPLEVDEGSFDIKIDVEGRDENGTAQTATKTVILVVDKERHDVRFTKKILTPSVVSCTRKNVQLTAGVINAGSEDEKGAALTVASSELGINFKDTFNLDTGAFDDSVKFAKTYSFNIPDNTPAGTYMINMKVVYDDGSKSVEDSVILAVNDCVKSATSTTTTNTVPSSTTTTVKSNENDNVVDLIIPPATVASTSTTAIKPTVEKNLFGSKWFVGMLIGAEVIGALIIIGVIIRFTRK